MKTNSLHKDKEKKERKLRLKEGEKGGGVKSREMGVKGLRIKRVVSRGFIVLLLIHEE